MSRLADVWPLSDLTLTTPRLTLRPIRDDDLAPLADAANAGIHDPDFMPFARPWTDADPRTLGHEMAKYQWRIRAAANRQDWTINFVVLLDDQPVGSQSLEAHNFDLLRTVSSGSWLTRSVQGQGLGTEMRAAILLFSFDWLGAEFANSGAARGNEASLGVSRRLGYRENGVSRHETRPGEVIDHIELRLAAADFIRPDWELTVTGFEGAGEGLWG
jgi:RimJ/RimL family protein N-acetyltransferase